MADPIHDGVTSKPEYAPHILEALRRLGGRAPEDRVLDEVPVIMGGVLLPGDRRLLYGGRVPRWRSQAEQMLEGLIEEGYVRREAGVLALTEKGRSASF